MENSCEHGGDHEAPPGARYCSDACSACDDADFDGGKAGCAGICGLKVEADGYDPAAELDAIPIGSAADERERAKAWCRDAARFLRDAEFWRDKRAYPAEEAVRMLESMVAVGIKHNERSLMVCEANRAWTRHENPIAVAPLVHEVPLPGRKG